MTTRKDQEFAPLRSLDDLDELRAALLEIYLRTPAKAAIAYRNAMTRLFEHPRLDDEGRRKLAAGFKREFEQRPRAHGATPIAAVPWATFVARLPVARSAGTPKLHEYVGPTLESPHAAADGPLPVHWNTRVLDGARALADLFVTAGTAYTIETGLDPTSLVDALLASTLAPGGLPDGTRITFEASCPQPILRGHDDQNGATVARVTHTAIYDAATGRCPPARFAVVPAAPGRIAITLGVVTDNAVRASTMLVLLAEAPAVAAHSTVEVEQAPRVKVSTAALTGPAVALRIELTPDDRLVVSDGVISEAPRPLAKAPGDLAKLALAARNDLVKLSKAYRPGPDQAVEPFALADAPAMWLAMAKIGATLHEAFFGHPDDEAGVDRDLRRLAGTIARLPNGPARLQIVASFQPYPWAVFYDGADRGRPLTDDPDSVDPAAFWGHRFRIDRGILGHVCGGCAPPLRAPVRVQACVHGGLDAEQGVRVVDAQRALFDALDVDAQPPIESGEAFARYVASETACDLLYLFCHATAATTYDRLFTYAPKAPDHQATLHLDGARPLDVAALRALRRKALPDHPLVFLNACGSAANDPAFQSPFLEQFLNRWRAGGLLGTDWEVPTVFADAFARRLVHHFVRERRPLGEAFARTTAEAVAQGNPFALVYALYARPELVITGEAGAAA